MSIGTGGPWTITGLCRHIAEGPRTQLEEGAKWVKERWAKVTFSPADRSQVDRWRSSRQLVNMPRCYGRRGERPERRAEFVLFTPSLIQLWPFNMHITE